MEAITKKDVDKLVKYLNDNDIKVKRYNEQVVHNGKVIVETGWYTFDLPPALLSRALNIMYHIIFDRDLTRHFDATYIYSDELF